MNPVNNLTNKTISKRLSSVCQKHPDIYYKILGKTFPAPDKKNKPAKSQEFKFYNSIISELFIINPDFDQRLLCFDENQYSLRFSGPDTSDHRIENFILFVLNPDSNNYLTKSIYSPWGRGR